MRRLSECLTASERRRIFFCKIGTLRTYSHRKKRTSFRRIFPIAASKYLDGRKPACEIFSYSRKNMLENPHTYPMRTSSNPKTKIADSRRFRNCPTSERNRSAQKRKKEFRSYQRKRVNGKLYAHLVLRRLHRSDPRGRKPLGGGI